MIHEYFGVDLDVVWKATRQDAPSLKPLIARLLEQEIRRERGEDA